MLSLGNKLGLFMIIILSILISCKNEYEKREDYFITSLKNKNEITEQNKVYNIAKDTINHWIQLDLRYFHKFNGGPIDGADWKIDEWIFFNSTKEKCLVNLLIRSYYNPLHDDIYLIFGEKTDRGWWFHLGPDLVVIQNQYSEDKEELAIPFSIISEVARKNALQWYYIKGDGHLINDKYFDYEFNVAMDPDQQKRIDWYLNTFLKSKYEED
jgi:hypothetical protein